MSQRFKVALKLLIILCIIITVNGLCHIKYSQDSTLRPNFYTFVGTRKIRLNLKSHTNNLLELYEHQEVEVQCENYFKEPTNENNQIFMKCDNYIYTKTDAAAAYDQLYNNSDIYVECSELKWNLYETLPSPPWCPENMTSYIMARSKRAEPGIEHLAVICFDTDNLNFNSVYYTMAPGHSKIKGPIIDTNSFKPGFVIKNVTETFGTNSISANDFNNLQFRNWIISLNYQYDSIIQHSKLYSTFNEHYAYMLEFLWWPNLRLHNWNIYLQALESHIEKDNEIYDILAGVSGTLEIPYLEECQTEFTTKKLIDEKGDRKIPKYIWNYLQSRNNKDNDIVIIGYNSAFNEFYSEDDIIFCKDKCEDISWLKKVSSRFHHSIMGLVFCCDVEEVRSSKTLKGFPGLKEGETIQSIFNGSDDASEEGEEE